MARCLLPDARMAECGKAQRTGKRQVLRGTRIIHFRDQRRQAFALICGCRFKYGPEICFQCHRSGVPGQAEGTLDQMAFHGICCQRPGCVLNPNNSRSQSNCHRDRDNKRT
jgi:hypothetical protein